MWQLLGLLLVSAKLPSSNTLLFAGVVFNTMESNSVYIYVGSTLTLNCTLKEPDLVDTFSAVNITFSRSNPKQENSTDVCVDSDIMIIDGMTAELTVRNVTLENKGQYNCFVGGCPNGRRVASSEDITVQYKPENVTDIKCYLYNWNVYLLCTWQHPVKYDTDPLFNDTYVEFLYNNDRSSPYVVRCQVLTPTSCNITVPQLSVAYTVNISVINNKTKDMASQIFYITPWNIVKPAPINNLNVKDVEESNCFNISWGHELYRNPWNMSFYIHLQTKNQTEWKLINEIYYVSCNYKPYTNMSVYVRCCPSNNFSDFYCSDPVNKNFLTAQKAPLYGPEAVNGSYISNTFCNKSGLRDVTLFWKDVEENATNGPIEKFVIEYRNLTTNTNSNKYQVTIPLPCAPVQSVKIFARNSANQSEIPTVLLIAPVSYQISANMSNTLRVEMHQLNAFIYWDIDSSQLVNLRFFWCQRSSSNHCEGKIYWKLIPFNQTYTYFTSDNSQDYNFGLSAFDQTGLSTPITWATCFYNPLLELPKIKILDVKASSQSATVMWDPIKCTRTSNVRLTGYIVKFCLSSECSSSYGVRRLNATYDASFLEIRNLKDDQIYNITVQAVDNNKVGPEADWKQVQPSTSSDSYIVPVVVTSVVVFSTLVFVAAIVIFFRCCRKSKEKFKSMAVNKVYSNNLTFTEFHSNSSAQLPEEKKLQLDISNTSSDQSTKVQNMSSSDSSSSPPSSRSKLIKTPNREKASKDLKANGTNDYLNMPGYSKMITNDCYEKQSFNLDTIIGDELKNNGEMKDTSLDRDQPEFDVIYMRVDKDGCLVKPDINPNQQTLQNVFPNTPVVLNLCLQAVMSGASDSSSDQSSASFSGDQSSASFSGQDDPESNKSLDYKQEVPPYMQIYQRPDFFATNSSDTSNLELGNQIQISQINKLDPVALTLLTQNPLQTNSDLAVGHRSQISVVDKANLHTPLVDMLGVATHRDSDSLVDPHCCFSQPDIETLHVSQPTVDTQPTAVSHSVTDLSMSGPVLQPTPQSSSNSIPHSGPTLVPISNSHPLLTSKSPSVLKSESYPVTQTHITPNSGSDISGNPLVSIKSVNMPNPLSYHTVDPSSHIKSTDAMPALSTESFNILYNPYEYSSSSDSHPDFTIQPDSNTSMTSTGYVSNLYLLTQPNSDSRRTSAGSITLANSDT